MTGCIEDYSGGGFSFNLDNDLGGGMPEVVSGIGDTTMLGHSSLTGGGKRKKKRRTGKMKRSNRSRIHGRSKKPRSKSRSKKNYKKKSLSKKSLKILKRKTKKSLK
jgi:hypothetical protein